MKSVLNGFGVLVKGMKRAKTVYGTILDTKLEDYPMLDGHKMAVFPTPDGVGGALVQGADCTPSHDDALLYLNGGDDLQIVQNRADAAGGRVLQAKTSIGENGFIAIFEDTKGGEVGLRSVSQSLPGAALPPPHFFAYGQFFDVRRA